jgi:hypothetical protein
MIRDVKCLPLAILLAVAALAGCGGEVDPATTPAGHAQVTYLENLYNSRFTRAYEALHPAYKAIVSEKQFADCSARTIPVGQLDSIEVLDVFDDPIPIPGAGKQPAKNVRVRITSTSGETLTFDSHELKVGARWYWVLNDKAVAAYKVGQCPGAG